MSLWVSAGSGTECRTESHGAEAVNRGKHGVIGMLLQSFPTFLIHTPHGSPLWGEGKVLGISGTHPDDLRGEVSLGDHQVPGLVQLDDGFGVGLDLGFERLVLLQLSLWEQQKHEPQDGTGAPDRRSGSALRAASPSETDLQVGRVLVVLVRGDLQLLLDPLLQLVGVPAEELEAVRVLQLLPPDHGQLLEAPVAVQNLLTALLDVLGRLQHFDSHGVHFLHRTGTQRPVRNQNQNHV